MIEVTLSYRDQMRINNELKRFVPTVQKRLLSKALREGPKATRTAVTRRLRERKDTGAMSKGLKVKVKRYWNAVTVRLMSPSRETLAARNPKYKSDAKGYYPAVQEYGSVRGVEPQWAYRKGFEERSSEAERKIRSKLWQLIKNEFAK